MKLKPRTTYVNGYGDRVCIAGLAKREVEGKQCWWSIQGDHYTDDGRFVFCRREPGESGSYINGMKMVSLTHETSLKNIVAEDTSESAKQWWDGVSE